MPYFYTGSGFLNGGSDPGQEMLGAYNKAKLGSLFGQAQTAPEGQRPTLLQQIAKLDPEMAKQAEEQFRQRDQEAQAKLVQDARLASGLYRNSNNAQAQTAYSALRERAQRALGGAQLPEELDSGTAGMLEQYAQINGPADQAGPAGLREFQGMTQGLSADDVLKARRVALGLDPRQSSAAIGYQKVTGPDGREYLVATDPRGVGAQTIGGGPSYGSMAGQQQGQVGQQDMQADIALANQLAQAGFDPSKIDAFLASRGQRAELAPQGPNPFASQSPGEKSYSTEAGQQRAQIDALPERGMLEAQIAAMKAKAEADARAAAERESVVASKAVDSQRTLGLLDEAERLLPMSTGSSAGSVVDSVVGAFGKSTPGAQAIAALQTIAGQLTSSMPRMQGPQSDKDVQLYKQMAGDLANPTLPVPTRLAALRQIRRLNEKYKGQREAPNGNGVDDLLSKYGVQ